MEWWIWTSITLGDRENSPLLASRRHCCVYRKEAKGSSVFVNQYETRSLSSWVQKPLFLTEPCISSLDTRDSLEVQQDTKILWVQTQKTDEKRRHSFFIFSRRSHDSRFIQDTQVVKIPSSVPIISGTDATAFQELAIALALTIMFSYVVWQYCLCVFVELKNGISNLCGFEPWTMMEEKLQMPEEAVEMKCSN
jgi:hypothetical protein